MNLILTFGFALMFHGAQAQSARVDSLATQLNRHIYEVQFDLAHEEVVAFLSLPDLTPMEKFYGHYYYGNALRAGSYPERSTEEFELAYVSLPDSSGFKVYKSAVLSQLAECYFDLQQFELAEFNARTSIELSPDTTIRDVGHAINHLILGYIAFDKKRYDTAMDHYSAADRIYRANRQNCELPLVFTKLALLYNAMGKPKMADVYLDSSRHLSNVCKIPRYIYLTERTDFDLLEARGRYAEALKKYDEISEIRASYKFDEKERKLEAMNNSYKQLLRDSDMQRLEELNTKNADVLALQRRAVWILVIGLVLLLVSVFFLAREVRLRRRAFGKLNALTGKLEAEVDLRTKSLEETTHSLEAHADKLATQNQRLVRLYHVMTHNLRAPLANMTLLVKFILETDDRAEQKELVSKLPEVVDTLNANCADLLDLIDASTADDGEKLTSLFFEDVLLKVMRTLRSDIDSRNAVVSYDFSGAEQILYSKRYLESLFLNLLSNALKYAHPGRPPRIEVFSKKQGDFVELTVKDNGKGLNLEKYGDEVFVARKTFHGNADAKGFGLYMTRMQLENYGGTIRMESTPDVGSTFIVRFRD